jgi:pimeloyl-ACP methyl ester carboxylesterase
MVGLPVVLVHGGLWDGITPHRFWGDRLTRGFQEAAFTVFMPKRPSRPRSWEDEIQTLASQLPYAPTHLVAGSNGRSVAVLFAAVPR